MFGCVTAASAVRVWPPPPHLIATTDDVRSLGWLLDPVLAWALGQQHLFSYFPGNDPSSIFPSAIHHLRHTLAENQVTFQQHFQVSSDGDWLSLDAPRDVLIAAINDNPGVLLCQAFGLALGESARDQLSSGQVMTAVQWGLHELSLRQPGMYPHLTGIGGGGGGGGGATGGSIGSAAGAGTAVASGSSGDGGPAAPLATLPAPGAPVPSSSSPVHIDPTGERMSLRTHNPSEAPWANFGC